MSLFAITDELIGKTVKLIQMYDDPDPIPPGTLGTVYHVGGGMLNVNWENGRRLGVIVDVDEFEIL